MTWNYEAIVVSLAQTMGGIVGFIITAMVLFYAIAVIVSIVKTTNDDSLNPTEVFNASKWKLVRLIIVCFITASVLTVASSHRPKVTATQGAYKVNDSMNKQKVKEFKYQLPAEKSDREKLVDEMKQTDEQTQRTWDSIK